MATTYNNQAIHHIQHVPNPHHHVWGHEQGVQHVLQLVKHLHSTMLNGQLYHALINAHQITAGSAKPILEHTDPIPWCPNGWITTLHHFLHSINTKICLQHPWIPSPWWVNDHNIMDNIKCCLPNADHKAINNVRLYLCVTYLSEIMDASRTTILLHALQDCPSSSRSTLKWPHQPLPRSAAWKHWQWAISHMYFHMDSKHLTQPLKEWASSTLNMDWQWDWQIQPNTMELYQQNGNAWTSWLPVLVKCTYVAYQLHQKQPTTFNPEILPPATPSIDSSQMFHQRAANGKLRTFLSQVTC